MITDTTYYTKGRILDNRKSNLSKKKKTKTKTKPLACCEDRMRRWQYTSREAFSLGTASARTLIVDFALELWTADVYGVSVWPECKLPFENRYFKVQTYNVDSQICLPWKVMELYSEMK